MDKLIHELNNLKGITFSRGRYGLWAVIKEGLPLFPDEIVKTTALAAHDAYPYSEKEGYYLTLLHDRLIELGVDGNCWFLGMIRTRLEFIGKDEWDLWMLKILN